MANLASYWRSDRLLPAARWAGRIRDAKDYDQRQWQKCFRTIIGEIVSEKRTDPSKRESRISPLFQSRHTGRKERGRSEEFRDAENHSELLRVSDVGEGLDSLRAGHEVDDCVK